MTASQLLLQCIVISLSVFSIALNVLGIYLLRAARTSSNSRFLLINLASSEIVLSTAQVIYFCSSFYTSFEIKLIILKIQLMTILIYYFSMFLLTIDRLVAILFPLKYRVSVTTRLLTRVVLAICVLAVCFGVSLFLSNDWFDFCWKYIWILLDVVYFILCCGTYTLIFYKMRSSRRLEKSLPQINAERRQRLAFNRERKFFKIVGMIIISFIVLIMVPDVLFYYFKVTESSLFVKAGNLLYMIWLTGFIADPVIFIFLQQDLRSLLKSKLCKFGRSVQERPNHQETAF